MQKLFGTNQLACAITCALLTTSAFAADQPAADKTPVTVAQEQNAAAKEDPNTPAPKVIWKPGETLETTTDTEDIVATYDIDLATKQVAAYPESPEAAFILAVALTRTSRVEEGLKQVQTAQRLASAKGGPAYFDKMIASYEKMLTAYPDDNQVRYGLAWAYYMKAYLLGQHSRRVAKWKAANPQLAAQQAAADATAAGAATKSSAPAPVKPVADNTNKQVVKALQSGNTMDALTAIAGTVASGKTTNLPHIPGGLDNVEPQDVPVIKAQYEKALGMIDEILKRDPSDVWSVVYGAHLRAEYTGDLESSMRIWRVMANKYPNNPGPFFFLGEGYLKQGNLRESLNNVGKAIALRALGN
jgi:tetratricopeptide (TPR) repeat protein